MTPLSSITYIVLPDGPFPMIIMAHKFFLAPAYLQRTDYGRPMKPFFMKFRTFVLGQTNWADKFWGIWGIFGQTISTNFGTVSSLSMFSIIQQLFLQKTKPLYPHAKYLFGI